MQCTHTHTHTHTHTSPEDHKAPGMQILLCSVFPANRGVEQPDITEQYDMIHMNHMICCKIKRSTCKACKRRRAPQQLAAHERQAGTQSMHRHALQRKSSEQRSRAEAQHQSNSYLGSTQAQPHPLLHIPGPISVLRTQRSKFSILHGAGQ